VFTEVARTDSFGAAHVTVDPIDVGAWGGKGASGRVAIRASAEGWACSDVTLASTTRGGRALRLVLPARESIFSGQLVDESGRPVAGADVELGYAQANQLSGVADADPSLPQPVRAVSDESGRFVAHGIDGSRGRVRVHAARADLVPTFVEQAVDGAAERACTIVLSAGGRVHGVVRDANGDPVPAARVWHEPAQQGGDAAFRSVGYVGRVRGWCSSTVADSEGTFDLAAVVPGARLLWAQNPSKPDELAHAMLDVASGASVSWNPELEHREPLQVVLDAGARAPHGWIVRLFFDGPNGRCIRESVTDGAGGASFYDVCADAIDVSVYAADTGFLAARSRIDRRENAAARVVLDEPAHIAGQLVDAQGAPFQDGILRLVPKDGQAPWTQLSYDAESGTFEHTLPASAFLLVASHGGSNVRIAELELAPGLRVELGPLRVPALSKLRLAHGAIPSIAGLEYRIVQIGPALPPSINMRVEVGAWPPPAERDLFPGDYVVESGSFLAKEVRVDRSVPVTLQAGGDVTLQLAP
jgi:protocatechuate 3,4-dioxygenase beta subunit